MFLNVIQPMSPPT